MGACPWVLPLYFAALPANHPVLTSERIRKREDCGKTAQQYQNFPPIPPLEQNRITSLYTEAFLKIPLSTHD